MKWKKTEKGYRSKAEERFAEYLETQGIEFVYESHYLPYQILEERKYWPDFLIKRSTYIEFKGRFTAADRKKMLRVKKAWPQLDIRLVFMQDNFLTKTSKTRYSDWARKYGFKYHVGISLPKKWIKELT